jgi:hypothetical protein
MHQKGGLEPLLLVPKFKYTFDEERKLFINCLYPYSDIFLNTIREINWNTYSYEGPIDIIYAEYKKPSMNIQIECNTGNNKPVCFFLGGTVYEILNQKFRNSVDYHSYADATSDVDVTLYLPKLNYNNDEFVDDYLSCVFINKDGKMNDYYNDFIKWSFNQFLSKVKSVERIINQIPNVIDFEIEEYIINEDLPLENKTPESGYRVIKLGKFYIITFINHDNTMFKIQLVCKVEDEQTGLSGSDHVVEIIIPLPDESEEGTQPTKDNYNHENDRDIVTIGSNNKFSIQNYNSLISNNLSAYKERAVYVSNKQKAHKAYNHVARLFYLYELLYQNSNNSEFVNKTIYTLQSNFLVKNGVFKYYKMINNEFVKVDVPMKHFADAYFKLFLKINNLRSFVINARKTNAFDDVILNLEFNGNKINLTEENVNQLAMFHDKFIQELFDETSYISGGKMRRRTTKKVIKKNKNKKTMKRIKKTRRKRTKRTK